MYQLIHLRTSLLSIKLILTLTLNRENNEYYHSIYLKLDFIDYSQLIPNHISSQLYMQDEILLYIYIHKIRIPKIKSSVTYPEIWRYNRFLLEMYHLLYRCASPALTSTSSCDTAGDKFYFLHPRYS